jgi:cytochrome c peroxidase
MQFAAAAAVLALAPAETPLAAGLEEPIKPIPLTAQTDPRKAALGQVLFFDRRLSRGDTISCASCHRFDAGGAFPAPFTTSADGKPHVVNAPSAFNVAFNFRQLWAGGANSVEEVVDQVVRNPLVFASSWDEVLSKLRKDAALDERFRRVYPAGLTAETVSNALGEYNRSLTTPNGRFDRYLRGDSGAISKDELAGYNLFKRYGCVACHQGVNVGGNMFQTFGVMGDYFKTRGEVKPADLGRFNVTHRESDRHVFKVPSLRNVVLTGPYFHDGSASTLQEAVDVMFKYQLGRSASEEDKQLIIKFLGTLTGEQPKAPR